MKKRGFSCDSITTIFDSWACANLRFANGNDISASRETPQISSIVGLVRISVLQMAMISLHREKRRKYHITTTKFSK